MATRACVLTSVRDGVCARMGIEQARTHHHHAHISSHPLNPSWLTTSKFLTRSSGPPLNAISPNVYTACTVQWLAAHSATLKYIQSYRSGCILAVLSCHNKPRAIVPWLHYAQRSTAQIYHALAHIPAAGLSSRLFWIVK